MPKMPLEISVKLTTSDEVLALRSKIESLQNELENMKKEHNRVLWLIAPAKIDLKTACRDLREQVGTPFASRARARVT